MDEKLCLQWNDFKENIISSVGNLKEDKDFTDVTLACEDGRQIEAHKIILSGSSGGLATLGIQDVLRAILVELDD